MKKSGPDDLILTVIGKRLGGAAANIMNRGLNSQIKLRQIKRRGSRRDLKLKYRGVPKRSKTLLLMKRGYRTRGDKRISVRLT